MPFIYVIVYMYVHIVWHIQLIKGGKPEFTIKFWKILPHVCTFVCMYERFLSFNCAHALSPYNFFTSYSQTFSPSFPT